MNSKAYSYLIATGFLVKFPSCVAKKYEIYYICYNQTSLQVCLRLSILVSSYHGDWPAFVTFHTCMVKKNVGTNQKTVKLIFLREQIYNTLHLLNKWFIMCFWREVLSKRSAFLRKCGVTEFKTLSKVKYISKKMFLLFTQRNLIFFLVLLLLV